MPRKPRLFISHSSRDADVAKELHERLSDRFSVFLDAFDLRVGDRWQDAIEGEIAGCHCAVVVLSPKVREKPDWVNAEAFAFSMRMRVYDRTFRMVPVLLDDFTEQELTDGPLAKSKLADLQAVVMTSDHIDVGPILVGLRPVLDQYEAMLPFQEVARSLAAIIGPLDPNAQEVLGTAIGLTIAELKGAAVPSRWLAAALLKCDRQRLEGAYRQLAAVAPGPARQIFRIAAPYTWVDPQAADRITRAGLASPPHPTLAMNATRRETPRLYVRRASLKLPEWTTFDCEAVFGASGPATPQLELSLLDSIRRSLAEKLGFAEVDSPSDANLNDELATAWPDEPVFVVLPPWFAAMEPRLLQRLRDVFPKLTYLIWTERPQPGIETKFPPVVLALPSLDPEEESRVYRDYNRCIPRGEPLL